VKYCAAIAKQIPKSKPSGNHSSAFDLSIEQVEIGFKSSLDGVSLVDAALRQKLGITVLAVQQSSGEMTLTLPPDYIIRGGDIVIALGSREGLNALRELGRGTLAS